MMGLQYDNYSAILISKRQESANNQQFVQPTYPMNISIVKFGFYNCILRIFKLNAQVF